MIARLLLPLLLVACAPQVTLEPDGLGAPSTSAPVSFVETVRIDARESVLDGQVFGDGGAYEKLSGQVVFAFDPAHPANADIVDLELAERRADGLVEAVADLMILRPVDPPADGGTALIEVSNRGGKASLGYFCRGRGGADPSVAQDFGDAWLLRRGITLVWLGWQADVPDRAGVLRLDVPIARAADGTPLIGKVRADWTVDADVSSLPLAHRDHRAYPALADGESQLTVRDGRMADRRIVSPEDWQFARRGADGTVVDDPTWIMLDGGFRAGHIYELVYEAQDPRVIGLGLAAMRDFAAWIKRDSDCPFPVEHTVAVGISQTGRFLRHFLWQGFNTAADGDRAFDGVMVMTAGAGRGSFNHRFAQPSRDAHRYSAFFYPTDLFPFSSGVQHDAGLDRTDGILVRAADDGTVPKVFQLNTGYEYWGRAAALTHVSVDGSTDFAPHPSERLYHLRSTQHFPVGWPRGLETGTQSPRPVRGSPIDNRVVARALLAALFAWVEEDALPPPSRIPSLADETLVPLHRYAWPELAAAPPPTVAHEAYRADYGPRWGAGIVDLQPPSLGAAFPVLLPQVNARGIEIAGVPNLETQVPLGSYAPWHLRAADRHGVRELTDFYGSFVRFSRNREQAEAWNDPRPDLLTLYADEAAYSAQIDAALTELLVGRWLLAEDVAHMRKEALRRYRQLVTD